MIEEADIQKNVLKKFDALPEDLKAAVSAVPLVESVFTIGKNYALPLDKIGVLGDIVHEFITGTIAVKEFVGEIQRRIDIPENKSRGIAREINKIAFRPIREAFKKATQVQTPTLASKPPTPPPARSAWPPKPATPMSPSPPTPKILPPMPVAPRKPEPLIIRPLPSMESTRGQRLGVREQKRTAPEIQPLILKPISPPPPPPPAAPRPPVAPAPAVEKSAPIINPLGVRPAIEGTGEQALGTRDSVTTTPPAPAVPKPPIQPPPPPAPPPAITKEGLQKEIERFRPVQGARDQVLGASEKKSAEPPPKSPLIENTPGPSASEERTVDPYKEPVE